MSSSKRYVVAITAMVVAVFLLSRSLAQDSPAAMGPTKVGVCDVSQVFEGYARGQELTGEFLKRGEKLQAEDEQRLKAIDNLTGELEGLLEGSGEYASRFNQVQRLKIDRAVWMQYEKALAERDRLRLTKEMYDQIIAVVGKIAAQRGIDIVLYYKAEEGKAETRAQLLQQMELRKVIYSSKAVDITKDVLTAVNGTYRAGKP